MAFQDISLGGKVFTLSTNSLIASPDASLVTYISGASTLDQPDVLRIGNKRLKNGANSIYAGREVHVNNAIPGALDRVLRVYTVIQYRPGEYPLGEIDHRLVAVDEIKQFLTAPNIERLSKEY